MKANRGRGVLDVFMFFSSTGGCINSTWPELGVRGLFLSPLFSLSSSPCSVFCPSLSFSPLSPHHLGPPLSFSAPPPLLFSLFSSFLPSFSLSSPPPPSSSLPVVLAGPHVAGLSWWCEPHGRPWLQADAQLGVCVCVCLCG